MDAAERAVRETIARARKVFASGAVSTLAILKEADRGLSEELHRIVERHGGPSGTFSEASAQLYRKQVQLATGYLEKRLAGHTHAAAMRASGVALRDTVAVAKALEKQFTGITRPLQLENQQMQDSALRGSGASLLRRHQASFDRYGKAMVADFERVMRAGQLEGLTHEQMVARLVEAGKYGGHNAQTLHENEPGSFPAPTSYVKRRYWAERIVRTELAYAANATSLQGMNVLRTTEFPDLKKKILAVLDMRTAPDSIAVHGQVRGLEEMFMDGAGRVYLHPPARPNDRETVIPWRDHWKENPTTEPPPAKEVAQAVADSQPGLDEEARRKQLQVALEKARARLLERKGKQASATVAQAPPTDKPARTPHAQVRGAAAAGRRAAAAERQAARAAAAEQRKAELALARERAKHDRNPGHRFKEHAQYVTVEKGEIGKAAAEALEQAGFRKLFQPNELEQLQITSKALRVRGGRVAGYYDHGSHPALKVDIGKTMLAEFADGGKMGDKGLFAIANAGRTDAERAKAAVIHELGHAVHHKSIPDMASEAGRKIESIVRRAGRADPEKDQRDFISEYGATSPNEYFAEAFAAYHLHPEWLAKHAPRAKKMVEEVLKVRGML